jgi:hypothetical protein
MASIPADMVIGQLLDVLREGFEGAQPSFGYFADPGPESALFGTLAALSAADASRPIGGTSVAAHAQHTAFGLNVSAAWIRGEREQPDGTQSWAVKTVDDATWKDLQGRLRQGYADLRLAIEKHAADGVEAMGGAIGAVAHVAYHLGAIRQKLALLKGK